MADIEDERMRQQAAGAEEAERQEPVPAAAEGPEASPAEPVPAAAGAEASPAEPVPAAAEGPEASPAEPVPAAAEGPEASPAEPVPAAAEAEAAEQQEPVPAVAEGPEAGPAEPVPAAAEAEASPAEPVPAAAEAEAVEQQQEPAPAAAEGPEASPAEPVPAAAAAGEQAGDRAEDAPAGEPAATEPEAGGQEPAEMPSIPEIRSGQLIEGTVVQIESDHLLVDVGYKSDGTVPQGEIRLRPDQSLTDAFGVGQRIQVTVMEVDGQDGGLLLSHRRAVEASAWKHLEEAHRAGEVVTAPVTEHVKGGLVVDVGLRGFMPASQVERGYVNDLSVYVGHPIRAKVIEIDRGKNRVILSQKAVLEEEHQRMRDKTWADLSEGQVRPGVVKGLTDFGAFVDLGGVDGLLHVSEMAWGRVDHPSDVLAVGDEINVKVLRLDRDKEKISLGLKQVLPDPWETAEQRYAVGSIVDGKVMRLAPFGAFVQLEPGVEGLVHISQLADYHVNEPGEVVREGQAVRVKILRVSPEERRISLSLRDAERQRDRGGSFHHGNPLSPRSEPVTLGDMFGRLFDQARERLEDDNER